MRHSQPAPDLSDLGVEGKYRLDVVTNNARQPAFEDRSL